MLMFLWYLNYMVPKFMITLTIKKTFCTTRVTETRLFCDTRVMSGWSLTKGLP